MSAGAESEPRAERELAELLARQPAEPVDPERRAQARAAFLAAAARSQAAGAVRKEVVMDAAREQDFTEWLARVAPSAPGDAERRARTRAAYLSKLGAGAPAPRVATRRLRLLALTLAAAGILLVTFLLPESPRWKVELVGPVEFEGQEFRLVDGGRLASELEQPGGLVTHGSPLVLALGDALELELRTDSELRLPPLPELDGVSPVVFELLRGECYLRTRPGWRGNPLLVRTSFGDVRATGTVFGVLVASDCMCVCVAQGAVEVEGGGRSERVEVRTSALFVHAGEPATGHQPFPTDPEDPGQAHTGPLVGFAEAP